MVEKCLDYLLLKITNQTDMMFEKFKRLAEEHEFSKNELNFKQEVIFNPGAVGDTEMAKGMDFEKEAFVEVEKYHYDSESLKVQKLCEAHFTEKIVKEVKSKVNHFQSKTYIKS